MKKLKDNLELKTDFTARKFEIFFSSMSPNFVRDHAFEEFACMELIQLQEAVSLRCFVPVLFNFHTTASIQLPENKTKNQLD